MLYGDKGNALAGGKEFPYQGIPRPKASISFRIRG